MFFAAWWFIFGSILGSFANVVILRHGTSHIGGRSFCPNCKRILTWYELVPIFSWIALRGKCRTCHSAISSQYPLVELVMAAAAVIIGMAPVDLPLRILGVAIAFFLVCITVYDFKHTIIPDRWAYSIAALGFIYGVLAFGFGLTHVVAGPLIAFPLALLWVVSQGRWMGLGDAKLMLGAGWLLGILGGYIALMIAFISGAIVGLILIGITRFRKGAHAYTMKSEVPFGPFLILGICVVWFSALYDLPLPAAILDFLSLSFLS